VTTLQILSDTHLPNLNLLSGTLRILAGANAIIDVLNMYVLVVSLSSSSSSDVFGTAFFFSFLVWIGRRQLYCGVSHLRRV
jgi:hypothetical protein